MNFCFTPYAYAHVLKILNITYARNAQITQALTSAKNSQLHALLQAVFFFGSWRNKMLLNLLPVSGKFKLHIFYRIS